MSRARQYAEGRERPWVEWVRNRSCGARRDTRRRQETQDGIGPEMVTDHRMEQSLEAEARSPGANLVGGLGANSKRASAAERSHCCTVGKPMKRKPRTWFLQSWRAGGGGNRQGCEKRRRRNV